MLPAEKIVETLTKTHVSLSRDEIFEIAGLHNNDTNIYVFNLMRDHGRFKQEGKGRGTKYRLAVTKQPKQKNDIPNWKPQITALAESKSGVFSFSDLDIPEAFSHHIRYNLNEMIAAGTIIAIGSKRNRIYKLSSSNVEISEETEKLKLKPTLDIIWPIINKIRKGITINILCEKLPLEPKHKIYKAMRYLADENELEQFGERRSTTYSLPGEGEYGHDEAVQVKANSIKSKIMETMKNMKAARPLILEQNLLINRNILDTALNELVDEGHLKFFGERRGKMISLPHLEEDEICEIRDEQISIVIGVDPFSSKLAQKNIKTIAITQRFGIAPFSLIMIDDITNVKELKKFITYSEVQDWFVTEMECSKP